MEISELQIDVQQDFVELKQVEKARRIFLTKETWLNLAECRDNVEKALKENREYECTIDEIKDIRVHTTIYKNILYVHVRVWWHERPTRQGITLVAGDWNQLACHLTSTPENVLGVEVMTRLVKEQLTDHIRKACQGCMNAWCSQRDHECLMRPKVTAEAAMKHVQPPNPRDFIYQLAKEAWIHPETSQNTPTTNNNPNTRKNKNQDVTRALEIELEIEEEPVQEKKLLPATPEIILERPYQTYKKVLMFHWDNIKVDMLEEY